MGLFLNAGEFLGLSGALGLILAYLFASLVVVAVMVCLAEMVSVRPVPGAIFEYPKLYVDPALGYAVGFIYWLAYAMCLPTLIASAALITRYWGDSFPLAWTIFLLLLGVLGSNIFGIKVVFNSLR